MTQHTLQIVYDRFYGTGGMWPTLGYLQRTLNRRSINNLDAVQITKRIPGTLLKPFAVEGGYPAPTAKLILTVEGIQRCSGSAEDVRNFIKAVQWLARLADRFDLSTQQGAPGVSFTPCQMAEAVSLSLNIDRKAVGRLLAILEAEELLVDDGDPNNKQ